MESARAELDLPSALVPGSFIAPDLRLLTLISTDPASTHWLAEDASGHPVRVVMAAVSHGRRQGSLDAVSKVWAELNHPRVQSVHSIGQRDGASWVAWRASGPPLDEAIAAGMGTAHALLAALDVAAALEAAHASGCIHGCVAPGWVTLEADGARLTGFGWSSLTRGTADNLLFTAPELLDPSVSGTRAGDVYGFGMLVLQALYGDALPYWVLRDTPRLVRQLDPEPALAAELRAALEWSPAARSTGPRGLVDALLADADRVAELARTALADGQLDQAERLLDRLDALPSARPQQALRLSLARKRASRGAPDDAIRSLVTLAERSEDAAAVWLEIADLYGARNRPDDALNAARKAWELHRDRASAESILRTLVAVDTGNLEPWVELLLAFVEGPERVELVQRVALHRRDAGDPDGALAWLNRIDDPALDAAKQTLRGALGDPTARLIAWLEADDPGALQLALELAAPLAHPLLEEIVLAILDHDPEHLDARRHLARALQGDDLPAALEAWEALCMLPNATAADHAAHARCQMAAGHPARVLGAVDQALALEPAHSTALELGADAAEVLGHSGIAATHLSRWLELHASHASADVTHRLRLADLHRAADRPGEAAHHYREVLSQDPGQARAVWGLRVLERDGEALDLPFGPHEALASLLTPMIEAPTPQEAWEQAVLTVDDLSRHNAITAGLFEGLFARYPNWADPISIVIGVWQGTPSAAGPALAALWRQRPDLSRSRRALLLHRSTLMSQLPAADLKLPFRPDLDDPPELPSRTPISEGLVLLVDQAAVPLDASTVMTPTSVPSLPGLLTVFCSADQVYLAVDEGQLYRDGAYFKELRVRAGDRLTWRGVSLQILDASSPPPPAREAMAPQPQPAQTDPTPRPAPPRLQSADVPDDPAPSEPIEVVQTIELLPAIEALDETTEPREAPVRFLESVFIRRLEASEPAVVWEANGLLRALTLPQGRTHLVDRAGTLRFTQDPVPGILATLSRTSDGVEMTTPDGSVVTPQPNGSFTVDGHRVTFHERGEHASPADSPTVEMTRPTPPRSAWLLLDDGSSEGRAVGLTTSPFRLGRVRDCELHIRSDGMLSRVHCQLERVDGHWYAADCGSANGTRVNGLSVGPRVRLDEGDRIELGQTLLVFTHHGPSDLLDVPDDTDEQVELELELLEPDDDEDTRGFSREELAKARKRSAAALLTPQEGARMVEIANSAFSVLFRALDDTFGPGTGRAELQRMVDGARPPSLVSGLNIRDPELPVEAVVTRLNARAATERRQTLERELVDMVEYAKETVGSRLSPARHAEVHALLDALEIRRRLQR